VLALQGAHLLRRDEGDAELPLLDPLGGEHAPGDRGRGAPVYLDPASVGDLDLDHV